MKNNNILILVNNDFIDTKKNAIRLAKIIIKDKKYLTFIYFLMFNSI